MHMFLQVELIKALLRILYNLLIEGKEGELLEKGRRVRFPASGTLSRARCS